MLFSENVYRNMYAALQQAEIALESGDIPVGAVVVQNNRIIGKGYNQVELLKDSTAHAEMLAITAATNHKKDKFLEDCDIYVTLEPCVMCTGAILLSRIKNLYFATFEPKFGACGSLFNIIEDKSNNHKLNVYSGIYAEESKSLLDSFFKNIREKK